MEPYRIYLKAELAKLNNVGDFYDFMHNAPPSWFQPRTSAEIQKFFYTQDRVNLYVNNLDNCKLKELVEHCDKNWRRNNISKDLEQKSNNKINKVLIDELFVRPAEPHLKKYFEKNNYELKSIIKDPNILNSEPYKNYTIGNKVDFEICIGLKQNNKLTIIDGIHRAFQLGINGEKYIYICIIYN